MLFSELTATHNAENKQIKDKFCNILRNRPTMDTHCILNYRHRNKSYTTQWTP